MIFLRDHRFWFGHKRSQSAPVSLQKPLLLTFICMHAPYSIRHCIATLTLSLWHCCRQPQLPLLLRAKLDITIIASTCMSLPSPHSRSQVSRLEAVSRTCLCKPSLLCILSVSALLHILPSKSIDKQVLPLEEKLAQSCPAASSGSCTVHTSHLYLHLISFVSLLVHRVCHPRKCVYNPEQAFLNSPLAKHDNFPRSLRHRPIHQLCFDRI